MSTRTDYDEKLDARIIESSKWLGRGWMVTENATHSGCMTPVEALTRSLEYARRGIAELETIIAEITKDGLPPV